MGRPLAARSEFQLPGARVADWTKASRRSPFSSLRKARRCRGRSENKPCGLFDPAQGPRRMLAARPCFLTPKHKWPAFFTCWPFLFGAKKGTRSRPAPCRPHSRQQAFALRLAVGRPQWASNCPDSAPTPQARGRPSRPCARHAGAAVGARTSPAACSTPPKGRDACLRRGLAS